MDEYHYLRPEKILKRSDFTDYSGTPDYTSFAGSDGGFYDLFYSREPPWKPSSKHIEPGYGYEKHWRSTKAKVPGARVSSLGSDLMSKQPEEWKPCIKHVDPGTGAWIPWKPSRRLFANTSNPDEETKAIRRKYIPVECPPRGADWPPTKGRGTIPPNPQWNPPFRKNSDDSPQEYKRVKKHVEAYRNDRSSKGVSTVFQPDCSLPPVKGRRRLATYRDEQRSNGVGPALNYAGYNPSVIL